MCSKSRESSCRIITCFGSSDQYNPLTMRIGIDLGGTKTEGILMSDEGETLASLRVATPVATGYEAILDTITGLVDRLECIAGRRCAVGIGTPGSQSRETGTIRNSNTTCLNGRPFTADMERRLGRAVRIENDANCFALSEAADGAGAGRQALFGVIMGTGVGGGIVVNGRILVGANGIAGEWGHNVLQPGGPPCYCGRRGCVETLLSGPGLAANYGLSAPADARGVFSAAFRGERSAVAAVDRFLDNFGRAVAQVVNILDPDVIVIGGGLSNVRALYDEGHTRVAPHVFSDRFDTPIVPNRFGDSSGVRGAARLWPPGTPPQRPDQ
jgi:fructokinase